MSRLCLLVLFACTNNLVATQEMSVEDAFVENEIVPNVLDDAPTEYLTVQFTSGVTAELGNELTPTQVKDIPTITWDASSDQLYTVAMIDPDAPSRVPQTGYEFLHWLVGNVPGTDVASGKTLAEYLGATPPPGSGLHRYVLLVYEQPKQLELDNISLANRPLFSIYDFAEKYNLGDPIAGNFFQAQFDVYEHLPEGLEFKNI